jgi:hypothetical protein
MKRVFALAFLPVILSALETVNLIKDHSFEKDSEMWQFYAEGYGDQDSAVAKRHDPENAYSGLYSASCDTRTPAGQLWPAYEDSAVVIQGLGYLKVVSDLDSITLNYFVIPYLGNIFCSSSGFIGLYLNAGEVSSWVGGYALRHPDLITASATSMIILEVIDFPDDDLWHILSKPIKEDLEQKSIPLDAKVDSLFLLGWGGYGPPWRGQKVYWDDVRLMGYADYDVGVKYLLSPDSIGTSEALGESLRNSPLAYTPVAGIKNFGREDAPEFSVIAEIWDAETQVYYDSLPWSLTSDTEDTVTFADFTPTNALNHTLIVRTVMTAPPAIDESDEDDQLSKTLFGTGVSEPVTHPDAITLQVRSLTDPLHVFYSLPYTEPGTLTLYDASGRRVERINVRGSGKMEFGSALPSGVYIVRLETKQTTITKKAVVLR